MKKDKRIKMRSIYILLCLFTMTILIASLVFQILMTRLRLEQNAKQLLTSSHSQTEENISLYINNLESLLTSLCYNSSIKNYLQEEDGSRRFELFKEVQTTFSSVALVQNDMLGFTLYNHKGEFLAANGSEYRSVILANTITIPTAITYYTDFPSNSYIGLISSYYVITVPIIDINTSSINTSTNYLGAAVIIMDSSYIEAQLNAISMENSHSMIIDHNQEIILSSKNILDQPKDLILSSQSPKYISVISDLPASGWQLLTFLEKGTIAEDMKPILFFSILSALLIVICMLAFIIITNRYFLNPIISISHFMQQITAKTMNTPGERIIHYQDNNSQSYQELHTMEESMNHMLDSLETQKNNLLLKEKDYYEALLLTNRMEILAYKNQINPHFLYNTLDCIRGIAINKKAPEIVEISQSLSNMFRYVVKGENYVTVNQELEYLKEYETIINYRFMGRLKIFIHCEERAKLCYLPIFILQPIVENGIFHGLERKIGEGHIQIDICVKDESLHIKVVDDGVGMTEKELNETIALCNINENNILNTASTKKIGLSNIAHRLRLFYGKESKINIASTQNEGTSLEIIITARWEVPNDV